MRRLEAISRAVRKRFYYSVPSAGSQVGLGRSQAYAAAATGEIPTEQHGKFLLVPRRIWDRKVKRLLGGPVRQTRRDRNRAPLAKAKTSPPRAHNGTETTSSTALTG